MQPAPAPTVGPLFLARLDFHGRFLHASPSGREVLGHAPRSLAGRSIYGLAHPKDLNFLQFSHNVVLSDPRVHVITYRTVRGDGTTVWVEATARAVRDPRTDNLDHVVLAVRLAPPKRARRSLTATTTGVLDIHMALGRLGAAGGNGLEGGRGRWDGRQGWTFEEGANVGA